MPKGLAFLVMASDPEDALWDNYFDELYWRFRTPDHEAQMMKLVEEAESRERAWLRGYYGDDHECDDDEIESDPHGIMRAWRAGVEERMRQKGKENEKEKVNEKDEENAAKDCERSAKDGELATTYGEYELLHPPRPETAAELEMIDMIE